MAEPKLPKFLNTKIYKTGQTRGADDDVIFQNRVLRNGTVLIEYEFYNIFLSKKATFENGFIVLIKPKDYFKKNIETELKAKGLVLGKNLLIFYYSRDEWDNFNPKDQKGKLCVAKSRQSPLGGHYIARVPATTAKAGKKINLGFNSSSNKGAGIRAYEYASSSTIGACRMQLEWVFWLCKDSYEALEEYGMSKTEINDRYKFIKAQCEKFGLSDSKKLIDQKIINANSKAICPLCKEEISAKSFFQKVLQAEGRAVADLTVTELNLFHINELRIGEFNHKPYNLGWGHHHCNIVVKDSGIEQTLTWMQDVLKRNGLIKA